MVDLSLDEEHWLWSSLESGSTFCQGETSSGPRTSALVRLPLGSKGGPGRRLEQGSEPRTASCMYVHVGVRPWELEKTDGCSLPAFLVPPTLPPPWEITSQTFSVLTVQFTTPDPASHP